MPIKKNFIKFFLFPIIGKGSKTTTSKKKEASKKSNAENNATKFKEASKKIENDNSKLEESTERDGNENIAGINDKEHVSEEIGKNVEESDQDNKKLLVIRIIKKC